MSIKKSLFNFFALVAIAACGGGSGGAPEPAPVPAPPPAPTASISASPTTVYVDEDITLTWSSTNASSCEASDSWEGSKDPSGEEVVTATTNGDLTYTITCSGNGSAAASVVVSAEYEPQFNEDPVVISNIKLYSEVCTAYFSKTTPWIHFVIPVDINNDGWKDFIVHQSCKINDEYRGKEIDEPTPDLLIVQLSNGDGTYRDGNFEVFGERIPSLGGGSRKYDRGDLNGDGRDDFAFAMHYEDGRSGHPGEKSRAFPAVIMSKDADEYEVINLGKADWGHAVQIIENGNEVDAVFQGFTGIGLQAFRYENGEFTDVRKDYPFGVVWDENRENILEHGTSQWAQEFVNFNNYIVGVDRSGFEEADSKGIALWGKEDNNWIKMDRNLNPIQFLVDYVTWQGTESKLEIFKFQERFIAGFTPQTMCFFEEKIDDTERITLLALYLSYELKEGEIEEGESYRFDDFWELQLHQFFQIDNEKLIEIDSPFDIYDEKVFANFIDCRDINNDGYSDFARHVWSRKTQEIPRIRGGTPILNINNRNNKMIEYENNKSITMPGHSLLVDANQGQGYFKDINNDGIEDLVVFAMNVDTLDLYDGSVEIYLGKSNPSLK